MPNTTTADPDDPTSMALPVIGERVRLTDGDEGTVMSRSPSGTRWRVQDGDPYAGIGWSRWVELHEIAGYPEDPPSAAAREQTPVAYLVAERRAGKWLIGDEWSSEHDTLKDAREHLQRFRRPSGQAAYPMGILAVTLVEEIQ